MSQPISNEIEIESVSTPSISISIAPVPEERSFPWKTYFCFFAMAICTRAVDVYYQGIADKACGGSRTNVAKMMLCNYICKTICGITLPYWSQFSPRSRIFILSIIMLLSYTFSATLYQSSTSIEDSSLLHFPRIAMMICVAMNQTAAFATDITVLQHLMYFHGSCTNAFSTGSGIGNLLGASWALTMSYKLFPAPWMSIICCLVFPVVLMTTFFCILPEANRPTLDLLDSLNSMDAEKARTPTLAVESVQIEDDENFSNIGALEGLKRILMDYYKYSVPVMSIEIMWEICRGGFIQAIWPPKQGLVGFYGKFLWVFQFASAIGKASSNFCATTKYRKFLIIMFDVGIIFGVIHYGLMPSGWITFLRETFWGHAIVLCGLTAPLGIVYGTVIASTYYAIRTEIQNENERSFVMGGVQVSFIYGQIIGASVALLLHGIEDMILNLYV